MTLPDARRVVVRGAGDIASGTGRRLFLGGFSVVMTEIARPLCVRRLASFAEAVFDGATEVEGTRAVHAQPDEIAAFDFDHAIAVTIDPDGRFIREWRPDIVIDARMLKRNQGTTIDQAGIVGALGPGFHAGRDCHFVVETQRGHDLGRVIAAGPAAANTGRPAERGGSSDDRVLYSERAGTVRPSIDIGSRAEAGTVLFEIGDTAHVTRIGGIVRGMLRSGIDVAAGVKVADVDPLSDVADCYTISDRSNAIAGGVLEGVLRSLANR